MWRAPETFLFRPPIGHRPPSDSAAGSPRRPRLLDPRFSDNPFVTGDPHLRFYAGALLGTAEGHALGTLCVLDTVPRELTRSQRDALPTLARHVMAMMELRRSNESLPDAEVQRRLALEAARLTPWSWAPNEEQGTNSFLSLVHPDDRPTVEAALSVALAGRDGFEVECRLDAPADSPRWAVLWGRTLPGESVSRGLHGVFIDVTERRLEEERRGASQRLQSVGTLAGGVAHGVNNMMTVVLGFGEFAQAGLGPGRPTYSSSR